MTWRLILSGLRSPMWAAFVCAIVVITVVVSIMLMRLERKLVSRRVGVVLVGLRLTILFTLLLMLLQPVLTKGFDVRQRGRIVVAVDASLSMETQDSHASMSEKLRWAQALGMLGNDQTSQVIDAWIAHAESGREPDWPGLGRTPAGDAEQAIADVHAALIQEAVSELSVMPRSEFVRRLLTAKPRQLLDELGKVMPIDLRLFAGDQGTTSPTEFSELRKSGREELSPGQTDVFHVLNTLIQEENSETLKGVVLLTDGRQTIPGDTTGLAGRLRNLDIPVYAVPVGSRLPPRDLSVTVVNAPEAVFIRDQAQIRAVIGASGFEGQTFVVRLKEGDRVLESREITPSSDTAVVNFSVPSEEPGQFEYEIAADIQDGELRTENNARTVNLRVVDNKARVMLVDGDARWEFRYLKNLLERDNQVESQMVLFRQPFLDLLNQPYISSTLPAKDRFQEALSRTDLLIVGDVDQRQIDEGVWELIETAVQKDGLTVVFIPGRRSMPHGFTSATLQALLPVSEFRQRTAEQLLRTPDDAEQTSFQLILTPQGQSLSMFQLSLPAEMHESRLTLLPGHPWIYGAVARPGASVWATATIPGLDLSPEPVILHQDYGFGQTVWLGIDSTWRWRFRAGDEWHYRFWGQLIRWAARNKTAAGNDNVRLSLSSVVVRESESAEILVRWADRLVPQLKGTTVEAVIVRVDPSTLPVATGGDSVSSGKDAAVTLLPSGEHPERYIGRLPRLSPGTWRVQLRVNGGDRQFHDLVQTEFVVRQDVSAELANLSCNRDFLRQLSEASGGQMVEPWEAERLISLIRPDETVRRSVDERTLWDHWSIVLVFFGLLTTEWVVRKVNGLP